MNKNKEKKINDEKFTNHEVLLAFFSSSNFLSIFHSDLPTLIVKLP
jgi:hypothetical protein